jgi:hypothetical protein
MEKPACGSDPKRIVPAVSNHRLEFAARYAAARGGRLDPATLAGVTALPTCPARPVSHRATGVDRFLDIASLLVPDFRA